MQFKRIFKELFLPAGYPNSVSNDYAQYQMWDSLQAVASSLMMAISMTATLQGYGVGIESASVYASTMTYLFKDGIGMLGRIVFAWYLSSCTDMKRWRLMADISNDISFAIEMLIPRFVNSRVHLIVLFSIASIFRAFVGVAGGAARAMVAQHQARKNNIGDVMAKDSSQEVLVNLLSLFSNFLLVSIALDRNYMRAESLLAICLCVHLFCNYRLVRSIRLESLNVNRIALLAQHYALEYVTGSNTRVFPQSSGYSIEMINRSEPIFTKVYFLTKSLSIGFKDCRTLPDSLRSSVSHNLKSRTCASICDGSIYYIFLTEDFRSEDLLHEVFVYCLLCLAEYVSVSVGHDYRAKDFMMYKGKSNHDFSGYFRRLSEHGWHLDKLDLTIGPTRHYSDVTDASAKEKLN